MSISFERNGEWVNLHEFSNSEVISYLESKLNTDKIRFKLIATPKFCNGVMVKLDDVNFLVYADKTWIELSFERADAEKLSPVIEEITKWDKFSQTEKTFYVEIDKGNSRTIIFENGYATCSDYKNRYRNDELKFTTFRR